MDRAERGGVEAERSGVGRLPPRSARGTLSHRLSHPSERKERGVRMGPERGEEGRGGRRREWVRGRPCDSSPAPQEIQGREGWASHVCAAQREAKDEAGPSARDRSPVHRGATDPSPSYANALITL